MITVDQKEIIRREYFLNRKSMREIAKELHHSRKTIRKAIYDPGIPVYKRSQPAPKGSIGPYVEVIQQWLAEDKSAPSNSGIRPSGSMSVSRLNTVTEARTGRSGQK